MTDVYKTDYALLPCPFCGGKAEYTKVGNSYIGIKEATIKCTQCHIKRTQKFIHKRFDFEWIDKTMVNSWNRRAESEGINEAT